MTNALSACFITMGESSFEAAVESIRPFVSEVVAVYTGEDDKTARWVARLTDRTDHFTGANWPGGGMRDFSKARNVCLALVTQPAMIWLDSDDTIEGGEHIAAMLAAMPAGKATYFALPYVYSRDAGSREQCLQWRERIVSPVRAFSWRFAVHECLLPIPGVAATRADYVSGPIPRIIHHRDADSPTSVARNIRILEAEVVEHPEDARTRYNLGLAYFDARQWGQSEAEFSKYVDMPDTLVGPDMAAEQRAIACMRLSAIKVMSGDPETALNWARTAVAEHEWAECYFQLARSHVGVASLGGPEERRHWERAAHYARVGLSLPLTQTAQPINPMERSFYIHQTLHVALHHLGDIRGAHASVLQALQAVPDDRMMLGNALAYEAEIARQNASQAAQEAQALVQKAEEYYEAGDIGSAVLGSIRQIVGAPVRPKKPGKLDIVFVCGMAPENWGPRMAADGGIGGSETAVIEMARQLSKRGHKVRVYNNCGAPELDGDVQYRQFGEPIGDCDVLIGWRHSQLIFQARAKVRWTWCHDVSFVGGADPWTLHNTQRVLGVSRWHVGALAAQGVAVTKLHQTRNGIDHSRFRSTGASRNPKRAIYSSSPTRGLGELLQIWPAVRASAEGAELEVYYGFDSWEANCRRTGDRAGLNRIATLKTACAATEGVTLRGRVNGQELANAMMRSGVWVHPSYDNGAGGRFHGAVPEVVRHGAIIEYGDDWLKQFALATITALVSPEMPGERETIAESVRDLSWDGVADQWEEWMVEDIVARKVEDQALVVESKPEKLKVHVILSPDGTGRQILDPRDPSGGTMGGGGKAGFLGLVRGLARMMLGYEVTAISTFRERRQEIDGVHYLSLEEPVERMDAVIAYYDVRVLQGIVGPLRIGMHHTLKPYGDGTAWPFTDVNTAPSEWAVEYLKRMRPRSPWRVVPNAVEGLENVVWKPIPGRVIHHTSPDRGLYNLLERWGEIRSRVPHATLHVIGKPQDIIGAYLHEVLQGSLEYDQASRLEAGIKTAREIGGVQFIGSLPREALLEEISEAACFASAFEMMIPSETWSITIHECCEIGVPCVIAPADALASLWRGVVRMTPPIEDDQGEFVNAVVEVLTNEVDARELSRHQKQHVQQYSFDRTAKAMSDVIEEAMKTRRKV
jgi:glycosyltransferase involved in cell wall biosynthesis